MTAQRRRELSCELESVLLAGGVSGEFQRIALPKSATLFLTELWSLQQNLVHAMHLNGEIRLYPA